MHSRAFAGLHQLRAHAAATPLGSTPVHTGTIGSVATLAARLNPLLVSEHKACVGNDKRGKVDTDRGATGKIRLAVRLPAVLEYEETSASDTHTTCVVELLRARAAALSIGWGWG